MQFIDQPEWGSATEYPDDPEFAPRYVVIHWGGSTSDIPEEDEAERLRIWQAYHINGRGWRDIAYNFAIGDSGKLYRCRGYNDGGHTSGVNDRTPEGDSYNSASLGVVWIGGANASGPSDAAKETMAWFIQATGIESVKAHSTVKQENGSNTACPGDAWRLWIDEKGWEDMAFDPPASWAQASWNKADEAGVITEHSDPWVEVTKQELMVFFDRMGLLD